MSPDNLFDSYPHAASIKAIVPKWIHHQPRLVYSKSPIADKSAGNCPDEFLARLRYLTQISSVTIVIHRGQRPMIDD